MTTDLFQPDGQLESECGGLGMNTVRATDGDCVLMLAGLQKDGIVQIVQLPRQKLTRLSHIESERGVEHIRAGHAAVDIPSGITDIFVDIGQKSDNVVLDLFFDLKNTVHIKFGFFLDLITGDELHLALVRERAIVHVVAHPHALDEGAELLFGFHGMKIAAVARDAGVANGTYYLHFKDKKALYNEIARLATAKLASSIFAAHNYNGGQGNSDRAEIEAVIEFAEQNKDYLRIALDTAAPDSSDKSDLFKPLIDIRMTELKKGIKDGHINHGIHPLGIRDAQRLASAVGNKHQRAPGTA